MSFFKKRIFTTTVSSEQLECSTIDKLLKNFSKNSRISFAHFSEFAWITFFFREQSSEFFSGQLKRSFDNPTETCWRKSNNFQQKIRETMEKEFFSRKKSLKLSAADLECSFDQNLEKIWSKVRETVFHFLKKFVPLFTFFWPMIQLIT